jgi:hypothetical protein
MYLVLLFVYEKVCSFCDRYKKILLSWRIARHRWPHQLGGVQEILLYLLQAILFAKYISSSNWVLPGGSRRGPLILRVLIMPPSCGDEEEKVEEQVHWIHNL